MKRPMRALIMALLMLTTLFYNYTMVEGIEVADNSGGFEVVRFYGRDRYDTAIAISDVSCAGSIQNVIITTGYNYPDALSGGLLASKLNASILLVGDSVNESKRTLDYIEDKVQKNGSIYILGDVGVVKEEIINNLRGRGFRNFVRLGGIDRYQTNKMIVDTVNVNTGTPGITTVNVNTGTPGITSKGRFSQTYY